MSSILLAGPAAEPISLAEAKAYLRVEHDDDDDVIAALIAGSRIHVEAATRRALVTQTWRIVRDAWPTGGRIVVTPQPLRDVTAARVYRDDGTTQSIDLQAFVIDTASAVLAFAAWSLPTPGRSAAGIELDVDGRLWRRGRRAGAAAPGDPHAGRALVREPRRVRGGCEVAALPSTVGRADRAVPGDVAMIDIGELKRRLVLEAPVETDDDAGGVTRGYATVTTLWAAVTPVSARGDVVADAVGATVTHRIVIRMRDDVTVRHRFREGDRIYRSSACAMPMRRPLPRDSRRRAAGLTKVSVSQLAPLPSPLVGEGG